MEMERKRAQSQRLILKARKKLYCVKDQFFYTGRGLNKGNIELNTHKMIENSFFVHTNT